MDALLRLVSEPHRPDQRRFSRFANSTPVSGPPPPKEKKQHNPFMQVADRSSGATGCVELGGCQSVILVVWIL
jgi:hypothetical protein